MNVRAALSEGTGALEKSRPGSPFLDAALLLGHALGIEKDRLLASMPEELGDGPLLVYRGYLARRIAGEPVAYIVGHKEFYGRVFSVDSRVLVPRPDTELLVEAALERLPRLDISRQEKISVHDAFTGSGCVGISIAAERPDVEVSLSDISEAALGLAMDNAVSILGKKLEAVPADILAGVQGLFHLISANPPYVSTDTTDYIMGDGGHEPRAALDGGERGLDLFPALVFQAWHALHEGGSLVVETGEEQAEDVSKIFIAGGFGGVAVLRDLAGHDRVVAGVKHAAAVRR
jgi:release factor glutamine methyltransferase